MVATGSGFTPGSELTLSGDGAFAQATADAAGNFQVPIQVPINPSIGARPADLITYTLEVEDFRNAAQNTTVQYQVTNFSAENGRQQRSPKAKRTWYFTGFPVGATIYGHFRHGGKTYSNYRFGKAAGPCGSLKKRAPGVPARTIRSGRWDIQLDTARRYKARTLPRIDASTFVFRTFRRR
jgi:hypothetical protein